MYKIYFKKIFAHVINTLYIWGGGWAWLSIHIHI